MSEPVPIRRFGPLEVAVLTRDEATRLITASMGDGKALCVAFANTNLVTQTHRNPAVAEAVGSFLVLNDGVGLDIASKLLYGRGFPDNLNGTDFTPYLLSRLAPQTKVFLYGGRPHVVRRAQCLVEELYALSVVGIRDGYSEVSADDLRETINASGAQVVLVATGNPRQEQWMAENRGVIKAPLMMGVGAWFDFLTGEFARAPAWVQRIRMEWLFRLLQEPRRLARRYTVDILWFLFICRKYHKSRQTA